VLVEEEVRGVEQPCALVADCFFDGGVCVAERGDANAAEEIEIVVAFFIAQIDAVSADVEAGSSLVGVEKQLFIRCLDGC
jgi:hypothetical protein